jgi:hypothetical protein
MLTILWERLDGPGLEYCEIALHPVVTLTGHVIAGYPGGAYAVTYSVQTNAAGVTVAVEVTCRTGGSTRHLSIRRDRNGGFLENGMPLKGFETCADVDLEATPSTNLLPIRRLHLAVGEHADLVALWIRCPDLTVAPLPQRYTRLDRTHYRYQSFESGYETVLVVDDDGVVTAYGDLWRRLARYD